MVAEMLQERLHPNGSLGVYDRSGRRGVRGGRRWLLADQLGRYCGVLLLPDTDQRMVVYSAAPDSPGGEALALLWVVGLQELSR